MKSTNNVNLGIHYYDAQLESLLQDIAEDTKQRFNFVEEDNLSIALYDKELDLVEFQYVIRNGKRSHFNSRIGGKGRTEWIIKEKTSLVLPTKKDIENWFETHSEQKDHHEQWLDVHGGEKKTLSWIGIPMIVEGEVKGVLTLSSKRNESVFKEDDVPNFEAHARRVILQIQDRKKAIKSELFDQIQKKILTDEYDDEYKLFEELYSLVHTVLKIDNFSIATYDKENDTARFVFAYSKGKRVDQKRMEKDKWRVYNNVVQNFVSGKKEKITKTGKVIHDQKHVLLNTPQEIAEVREFARIPGKKDVKEKSAFSWLGLPMIYKNKVLGVVAVHHFVDNHFFNTDDVLMLRDLASITALAYHNTKLSNEFKIIESLGDQIIPIREDKTEKQVIELVVDVLVTKLKYDNLTISFYDKYTDKVQYPFVNLVGKELNDEEKKAWRPEIRPSGKFERMIRLGESILLETQSEVIQNRRDNVKREIEPGIPTSWLGVPMRSGKRTIGCITTCHYSLEKVYNETDLRKFQQIAKDTANAIDNLRIDNQKNQLVQVARMISAEEQLGTKAILLSAGKQAMSLLGIKPEEQNIHFAIVVRKKAEAVEYVRFLDGQLIERNKREQPEVDAEQTRLFEKLGLNALIQKCLAGEELNLSCKSEIVERLRTIDKSVLDNENLPTNWLGIPIKFSERVLGSFIITHSGIDSVFEQDDVDVLKAIADQTAIALEAAIVKKHRDALAKIEKLLVETKFTSEMEILDEIFKDAQDFINVNHAFIVLNNGNKNEYNLIRAYRKQEIIAISDRQIRNQYLISKELIDRLLKKDVEQILIQTREDFISEINTQINDDEIPWTWLGVPLRSIDGIIGVFVVINFEREHAYDIDECQLINTMTDQAANAVNKFRQDKALKESEERYHSLVENNPTGQYSSTTDDEGTFRFTNKSFLKIFGVNLDDENQVNSFMKTPVSSVYEDPAERKEMIKVLKRDGKVDQYPLRLKRFDNTPFWAEISTKLVKKEGEEYYDGILEDVTKRKTYENRQKALLSFSSELSSKIDDGIEKILKFIRDKAKTFMDVDNMYIALYDHETDLISFPLYFENTIEKEIPSRIKKDGKGRTEYILNTGEHILIKTKEETEAWYKQPGRAEYTRQDQDLSTLPPSWIGVPMKVGDKIIGVVATYHPTLDNLYNKDDLEILQALADQAAIAIDNARLLEDINEYIEKLKEARRLIADKERKIVQAGIAMEFAHKLKNLVGTLPQWASLIKRKLDPVRQYIDIKVFDYIEKIQDETKKFLKEVDNLRQPQDQTEVFDIIPIIKNVVDNLRMSTLPAIEFIANFNKKYETIGIKRQLALSFYNVLQNAVKSINDKGTITIDILDNQLKDRIKVRIADTGCGIPPGKFEEIFEDGVSLWDEKSSGYGLWRTRSVLEHMGCKIYVEKSELGKGSIFIIELKMTIDQ